MSTRNHSKSVIASTFATPITMLLSALMLLLITLGYASPGAVFGSRAPASAPPTPEVGGIEDGDMKVASNTGAFKYSYPIAVPPGRLGQQPSLALSYSSQGALRGGIAAGWSLSIPEIKLTFPEGRNKLIFPLSREKEGVYVSSMSGGHRLIRTVEPSIRDAYDSYYYHTYRAEYDDQYIRYTEPYHPIFPLPEGPAFLARTLDGTYYEFGNSLNIVGFSGRDATRWPITTTIDKFGNAIDYHYKAHYQNNEVEKVLEFIPTFIEYGRNHKTGTEHYAKVQFSFHKDYSCGNRLNTGNPPAGSLFDYGWKHARARGTHKLTKISTHVKDKPGDPYRPVRKVDLGYDLDAQACDVKHSSLRVLSSITESAPAVLGQGSHSHNGWIEKPAITFEYGPLERQWNETKTAGLSFIGRGGRSKSPGSVPASLQDMLLDYNGDGIVDRLSSHMGAENKCQFVVRYGNGEPFALSDIATPSPPQDLPMVPWRLASGPTGSESCFLNRQVSHYENRDSPSDCAISGSVLNYRFMDMDADGLMDMVAAFSIDPWIIDPLIPGFGVEDSNGINEISGFTGGDCPVVEPKVLAAFMQCDINHGGGDGSCEYDQVGAQQILSSADRIPCGYLYRMRSPDVGIPSSGLDVGIYDPECGNLIECERTCSDYRRRLPETRDNRYVWGWWKNEGGVLSTQRQETLSPVPLVSNAGGEESLTMGALMSGPAHGVFDITGDGFADAISLDVGDWNGYVYGATPGIKDVSAGIAWFVWPGDGTGQFKKGNPILWAIPYNARLSGSENEFLPGDDMEDPIFSVKSTTMMLDVNSDGLLDHLELSNSNTEIKVHYNTGLGLGTGPFQTIQLGTLADPAPPLIVPTGSKYMTKKYLDYGFVYDKNRTTNLNSSCTFLTVTCYIELALKKSRAILTDVDSDGLPDFSFIHHDDTHHTAYGNPWKVDNSKETQAVIPARSIRGGAQDWRVIQDFLDIDGDGVMDQLGYDDLPIPAAFKTDDFAKTGIPMRLMKSIDNGQGLHSEIRYAPNNSTEVALENEIKGMPNHVWVVKSVSSKETSSAGFMPSPDSIIKVRYDSPMWNQDNHGHWGFRGFESIAISSSHQVGDTTGFSVTEQKYDFDIDWSGRLGKTVVYADGFERNKASSISKEEWQELSLFGGKSLSYVSYRSRLWNCELSNGDFKSYQDCSAGQPIKNTKSSFKSIASEFSNPNIALAYFSFQTREWGETLDKNHKLMTYNKKLYSDSKKYILVEKTNKLFLREGGSYLLNWYEEYYFDIANQYTYKTKYLLEPSSSDAAYHELKRSPSGQVVEKNKPEQQSGPASLSSYGEFEVHVSKTTNELEHVSTFKTDLGSGLTTEVHSPNTITCENDTGPEGSRTEYDGLGRMTNVYKFGCLNPQTYGEYRIQHLDYSFYTTNNPTHVTTTNYLNIDETQSTVATEYYDGHGRVVQNRQTLGTDYTSTVATTDYEYATNGKLRRQYVPNPSLDNNMDKSVVTYDYDSLGRYVGARTSNVDTSNSVAWAAAVGINVSYGYELEGATKTVTEVVQDGSPVAVTKTYNDSFGRLVRVDENADDATGVATTIYGYDALDNLEYIKDADSFITRMEHDWLSRRTKIVRGAREWKFGYDKNNNVILETSPVPNGQSEVNFQTSYEYDDLDRVKLVKPAVGDLNANEQLLLGAAKSTEYTYDQGPGNIGRLNKVNGSYFDKEFIYDSAGQIASERMSYNVSTPTNIGGTVKDDKTRYFEYNSAGAITKVINSDGQVLQYEYDSAGSQNTLSWAAPLSSLKTIATSKRNVAGLVTSRSSGNNTHAFIYDNLGRVRESRVTKSGGETQFLEDIKAYSDNNEVLVHEVLRRHAGALDSREFNYKYDQQHQLTYAHDGKDYIADFSFTGAGRTTSAKVNKAGTQLGSRNVSYSYGDPDDVVNPVDGHAVVSLDNQTGGSTYASYAYDVSGNVTNRRHYESNIVDQEWNFRYDGMDRQRRVEKVGGNVELYYYDENGQRFLSVELDSSGASASVVRSRHWFGNTEYWYEKSGDREKAMTNFTLGGMSMARLDNDNGLSNPSNLEYTFHSGLGHLMGVTDATGDSTTSFIYGPFGEVLSQLGDVDDHLRRFNGKENDQISGLNYYGYRYYDPLSLAWTQADPLYRFTPDLAYDEPRRMSLYSFSQNNPVRYMDPDGKNWLDSIAGAAVGAVDAVTFGQYSKRILPKLVGKDMMNSQHGDFHEARATSEFAVGGAMTVVAGAGVLKAGAQALKAGGGVLFAAESGVLATEAVAVTTTAAVAAKGVISGAGLLAMKNASNGSGTSGSNAQQTPTKRANTFRRFPSKKRANDARPKSRPTKKGKPQVTRRSKNKNGWGNKAEKHKKGKKHFHDYNRNGKGENVHYEF